MRSLKKFGNYTRKTFDRFTTKDSYNWNITQNTAVWSLKPERWGSLLVQEKYQEEMPVTETAISYNNNNNNNNNIFPTFSSTFIVDINFITLWFTFTIIKIIKNNRQETNKFSYSYCVSERSEIVLTISNCPSQVEQYWQ